VGVLQHQGGARAPSVNRTPGTVEQTRTAQCNKAPLPLPVIGSEKTDVTLPKKKDVAVRKYTAAACLSPVAPTRACRGWGVEGVCRRVVHDLEGSLLQRQNQMLQQRAAMVKRVLVIVSGKSTAEPPNWYQIFSGCTLASGEPVEVDQAE
jgi:hypothetical protein